MMLLPLLIGASCVITSIIGTFFVKLGENNSIMGALYKGFIATAVLSAVALGHRCLWLAWVQAQNHHDRRSTFTGFDLFSAVLSA
jgi:K(+)-stimulated pyrophosphate-energized sodium pump